MELRTKVLKYRAIHGLTQGDFAALCKLSVPTIVTIEKTGKCSKLTAAKILLVIEG